MDKYYYSDTDCIDRFSCCCSNTDDGISLGPSRPTREDKSICCSDDDVDKCECSDCIGSDGTYNRRKKCKCSNCSGYYTDYNKRSKAKYASCPGTDVMNRCKCCNCTGSDTDDDEEAIECKCFSCPSTSTVNKVNKCKCSRCSKTNADNNVNKCKCSKCSGSDTDYNEPKCKCSICSGSDDDDNAKCKCSYCSKYDADGNAYKCKCSICSEQDIDDNIYKCKCSNCSESETDCNISSKCSCSDCAHKKPIKKHRRNTANNGSYRGSIRRRHKATRTDSSTDDDSSEELCCNCVNKSFYASRTRNRKTIRPVNRRRFNNSAKPDKYFKEICSTRPIEDAESTDESPIRRCYNEDTSQGNFIPRYRDLVRKEGMNNLSIDRYCDIKVNFEDAVNEGTCNLRRCVISVKAEPRSSRRICEFDIVDDLTSTTCNDTVSRPRGMNSSIKITNGDSKNLPGLFKRSIIHTVTVHNTMNGPMGLSIETCDPNRTCDEMDGSLRKRHGTIGLRASDGTNAETVVHRYRRHIKRTHQTRNGNRLISRSGAQFNTLTPIIRQLRIDGEINKKARDFTSIIKQTRYKYNTRNIRLFTIRHRTFVSVYSQTHASALVSEKRRTRARDACNMANTRASGSCNMTDTRASDSCNMKDIRTSDSRNMIDMRLSDSCNMTNARSSDKCNITDVRASYSIKESDWYTQYP